ncbi:putative quinol monooxygenase [Kitasatospora indigofera]|uniref:Antibiotic biosynthesis monooxygenase n=1 Tax=Kitasatospora indigofera TaxID=67307 RepID=A0A919FQL9_9ACTN|nr:antibiotic biosynthesis monooxygenase [Kitasatospora indigofera]GHH70700.1 antibiotic biosynthesis monooxygenase [Kitasatospora indigofera]
MSDLASSGAGFIAIVTLGTEGPEVQRELVELLVKDVEEWVRHCPGFIAANYHASVDGRHVVNYAQWRDEAAYRDSFRDNPRAGELRATITAMPGVTAPSMVGYTLVRTVPAA